MHYLAQPQQYTNTDFKALFNELIANPKTDINPTDVQGQTLAMQQAYTTAGSTAIVEALLQRVDLDINTIRGNNLGTENQTLLDMIVFNCIPEPILEIVLKEKIEAAPRWLAVLRKMTQHPNFLVTPENIQRAEALRDELAKATSSNAASALKIADEAIELLKKK